MVVNAPQSNVLSAAEHTLALLIAQARNIPQADADLKAGNWRRSRWEGVELHGKTLAILGLGRVGGLVAQRALAFGMRLIAYDPYVSADRARQLGVQLGRPTPERARPPRPTSSTPSTCPAPRPTRPAWCAEELLRHGQAGASAIVNTARGGIVDEEALADADRRRCQVRIALQRSTCSTAEPADR